MSQPDPLKTCSTCGRRLPITEFRRRHKGKERREGTCRECHNWYNRRWKQRCREDKINEFAKSARKQHDIGKLAAMCNAMFARFGGVDGFAAAWKGQIDDMRSRPRPPYHHILRSFQAVAHILAMHSKATGELDLEDMSEEELQRIIENVIAEVL